MNCGYPSTLLATLMSPGTLDLAGIELDCAVVKTLTAPWSEYSVGGSFSRLLAEARINTTPY